MLAGLAALALSACSTAPTPRIVPPAPPPAVKAPPADPMAFASRARIVDPPKPLECVIYARHVSGIPIRGDAGTWWNRAQTRYMRGQRPEPGSVLAFKPAYKSSGHLAVVAEVLGPRLLLVNHANWLNRGRIHQLTPVQDVSRDGDWTAVRVWYVPGGSWGRRTYPTHGFIYRRPILSADALS
jgi:hypothetical protein